METREERLAKLLMLAMNAYATKMLNDPEGDSAGAEYEDLIGAFEGSVMGDEPGFVMMFDVDSPYGDEGGPKTFTVKVSR